MKQDSLEYRVRRKSELSGFMGAGIDDLLEQEAKQSRARIAAQVIGAYVARQVVHAAWVRKSAQ